MATWSGVHVVLAGLASEGTRQRPVWSINGLKKTRKSGERSPETYAFEDFDTPQRAINSEIDGVGIAQCAVKTKHRGMMQSRCLFRARAITRNTADDEELTRRLWIR